MAYTIDLGDKAPRFETLLSTDGSFYSIDKFNKKPLKVIFFTCNHCPYVTGSDELTRGVAEDFVNEAEFIAINSNSRNTYEEDSYENMILRMEKFNFPWVYLHDETQKVAEAYGALKTPHTDNPKDTDLRTTEDLHNVLKEATAGKSISIPITNPIGCNIKWDGKPAHWMPPEACDLL